VLLYQLAILIDIIATCLHFAYDLGLDPYTAPFLIVAPTLSFVTVLTPWSYNYYYLLLKIYMAFKGRLFSIITYMDNSDTKKMGILSPIFSY
jgi:hypothetical protein